MHDADRRFALAFAIAHEIGNHLAGIRLEAHLLDEALGARGLAKASLAIDSLAGQAAPLLALFVTRWCRAHRVSMSSESTRHTGHPARHQP